MSRQSGGGDAGNQRCPQAILRKLSTLMQRPAPKSYPPISSIPQTSAARLAQATEDPVSHLVDSQPKPKTKLYLAYGSNLSAETFLGMRGIRPISQMNVSVPMLELKFNLPGIPYREPCFANVDYRKLPEKPKLPDPTNPPRVPPIDPPFQPPPSDKTFKWDKGLVGVVYEVTEEDYGTIIRTEGGGSGYKEIVVPCIPIPARISVPEKPPIPELPKPFMARTLFAPQIPDAELPDDPRKDKWWYRFVVGPHRDPDYAQASARYLKLIRDGAKEHELPDGYQLWLESLQPYTITSWRQTVGGFLFSLLALIVFLIMVVFPKAVANKDGKLPQWMIATMTVMFNITWMIYDNIFKPVFGDGERTEDGGDKRKNHRRRSSVLRHRYPLVDEEKVALLNESD